LRQFLSARVIRSRTIRGGAARSALARAFALAALGGLLAAHASAASEAAPENIQLALSPRICTLALGDQQCDTLVRATWHSPHEESLCLVILEHPDVKRCWEKYSEGSYSIQLIFTEDVVFQLKDLDLRQVLASEVLRVIREAIRYRHKRRQPWNLFD
jgi:Protein of unknown function (DUF3019)